MEKRFSYKFFNRNWISSKIVSKGSTDKKILIGLSNGLPPNRLKTAAWTNENQLNHTYTYIPPPYFNEITMPKLMTFRSTLGKTNYNSNNIGD